MTDALLVVAHEATQTGSPRVLLDLMHRVRSELDVAVAVRLQAAGPLADELRSLHDAPRDATIRAVLCNSALSLADDLDLPVAARLVVYVHEEGEALRVLPDRARERLTDECVAVLCVSEASRADLISLGVDASRITLLPPVLGQLGGVEAAEAEAARAELGVDRSTTLVVGCGEAGWRKGADLFVELAGRLVERSASVELAWIGRRPRPFGRLLDHSCELLGVSDRLRWHGEVPSARPFLAAADVVVTTSREDPQPLVPLEAAASGTPTAGFAVGGVAELADAGACCAVDYPDVDALAVAALELASGGPRVDRLIDAATARIEARHSLDVVAPRFRDALLAAVDGRAVTP